MFNIGHETVLSFDIAGFTSMEKKVQSVVEQFLEDKEPEKTVKIKPWFDYNTTTRNKKGELMAGSYLGRDFSIQK